MNKNVSISAVAFIILILLSVQTPRRDEKLSIAPEKETAGTALVTGKNALVIKEQKIGDMVMVSSVNLSRKGFVVVHEKDNDQLGKIIGSSALLEIGESNNVEVALTEELQGGKNYVATLHFDNGDRLFRPGTDLPVMLDDINAGPIKTEFRVAAGI